MKENYFGKRLRALRTEKNISQRAFGEEMNVCNQTVSFWETGSREPDLDTLKAVAEYFETTTDYLLGLKDEE